MKVRSKLPVIFVLLFILLRCETLIIIFYYLNIMNIDGVEIAPFWVERYITAEHPLHDLDDDSTVVVHHDKFHLLFDFNSLILHKSLTT